MTKIFNIIFSVTVICLVMTSCSNAGKTGDFTLVLSGSMHGQLDPCGWKKNPMGGLSRRYVKIQELKSQDKNPIVLDAGDLLFSTTNLNNDNLKSEEFRSNAIIEGYNKIGCDAINVGKYELLNGLAFLKDISKKTDTPFLSANLKSSKTNELLFEPYLILNRGNLTIGIVGVTSLLPDSSTSVVADDFIQAGNTYIDKLSEKTDIIILLVNTDRGSQKDLSENFKDADFIVTSGSTNLTRTNAPQKDNGPYVFSCGKQGKYLLTLDAKINDLRSPFVNISAHQKKIADVNKRFERLQKKDPNAKLEDIYKDQGNVLKLIEQYRVDLKSSEKAISESKNTIMYKTIGLNKKIKDDPEMLAFVNQSLSTCKALKPQLESVKKSKVNHSGHDH